MQNSTLIANTILPEHQAIFGAYPQLEITVNHG